MLSSLTQLIQLILLSPTHPPPHPAKGPVSPIDAIVDALPGTSIAAPDTASIVGRALQMASHQLCTMGDSKKIQGLLALQPNKAQTYIKQCNRTLIGLPQHVGPAPPPPQYCFCAFSLAQPALIFSARRPVVLFVVQPFLLRDVVCPPPPPRCSLHSALV